MLVINAELQNIYLKHLANEFGQHGFTLHHGVPMPHDPWWWPVDPANKRELWGLGPEQEDQFLSLCTVPQRRRANLYSGFGGSLCAQKGCVFVVGERPSFNRSYASAVTHLHRLLPDAQSGTKSIHFTDVIKFRGKRLNNHLTKPMIEISTRCLVDEVELLAPSGVLITDMALDGLKALVQPWNPTSVRLAPLISHSRLKVVPHWKKNGAAAAWTKALWDLMR
jgi:hypothetical protein